MREAGADGGGHPLPQEAHTLRRRDHQRMVRWIPSGKDNNGFAIKRDNSSLNLYTMLLFIDLTTVDFSLSPTSMQCCTGQCCSNVAGLSQATGSCFCLWSLSLWLSLVYIQTITGLSQWEADTEHFLRDVQDVLPSRRCRQVLRECFQDI